MNHAVGSGPVPIAVVGAGAWGKNHVRTFAGLASAEVRYVCERDEVRREQARGLAKTARWVPDLAVALADPELRAVVIATEAPSHFALASRALAAGKDVLVEKPLTLKTEQAAELVRLADQHGAMLMVDHLLLYHPAVECLRGLIEDGELGTLLYAYTQRTNFGVVRLEENAWWSLAPHDISVLQYLLGSQVTAVSAQGEALLQPDRGVQDVVFATLQFASGQLGHVHTSWLDPNKVRRITVVGSRKMAVFDDTAATNKLVLFDKSVAAPLAGLAYPQPVQLQHGPDRIPELAQGEPLPRACEAFLQSVRSRTATRSDGRSGLSVVRVLEAGSLSLARAGSRVEIEAHAL